MLHKALVLATASIMVTALSLLPADARSKKPKRHHRPHPISTSLDGRTTGQARTCGYDTFIYDGFGVPVGPYCH